jgi:hypothetical protein
MILAPIVIDTQSMADQFTQLTADDINNMLDNIAKGLAASFAAQLQETAAKELKATRNRYLQSIKLVDSGMLEGTVMLDYSKDKLIQMIEEGAAAFDMKAGFMASAKVKIGKNGGKYLTIPLRQGVPGTIGDSGNFAFIMPKEIWKIAKNKPLTIPVSGGGSRSAGISLSEIPAQFATPTLRPAIQDNAGKVLFKEYQHKTPDAQGITKYQDPTTGQNRYMAFRRVSEKSNESAFIHPGIKAYHLIQKTLGNFNEQQEMTPLIDGELTKLGLL